MREPLPALQVNPLPYLDRLGARERGSIDLVVMHCTELPDLATARTFGEQIHYPRSRTGNSGHFYVDRDGSLHQWVDIDHVAHHTRGYNMHSIGIELVNSGRWPRWLHADAQAMDDPYPEAQVDALIALLQQLREAVPSLARIAGHEDLDRDEVPAQDDPSVLVRRKRDPGPLFPWDRVLAAVPLQRVGAG